MKQKQSKRRNVPVSPQKMADSKVSTKDDRKLRNVQIFGYIIVALVAIGMIVIFINIFQ